MNSARLGAGGPCAFAAAQTGKKGVQRAGVSKVACGQRRGESRGIASRDQEGGFKEAPPSVGSPGKGRLWLFIKGPGRYDLRGRGGAGAARGVDSSAGLPPGGKGGLVSPPQCARDALVSFRAPLYIISGCNFS